MSEIWAWLSWMPLIRDLPKAAVKVLSRATVISGRHGGRTCSRLAQGWRQLLSGCSVAPSVSWHMGISIGLLANWKFGLILQGFVRPTWQVPINDLVPTNRTPEVSVPVGSCARSPLHTLFLCWGLSLPPGGRAQHPFHTPQEFCIWLLRCAHV